MGAGSIDSRAWASYSTSIKDKTADEIYRSTAPKKEFKPDVIKVREAFDNADHPNSTPVIIALDVTGSMGGVLETAAKRIGDMMTDMIERGTVTDPQISSMAIGDIFHDSHPFQWTQFESDMRAVSQLTELHFERGGGGNDNESYVLAWLAAAYITDCDAFKKRGKKGFLFTIGDEQPTQVIPVDRLRRVFADSDVVPCPEAGMDAATALLAAEQKWHCFHIIVAEGDYPTRHGLDDVLKPWTNLMGQRAIVLRKINDLPEVITSIIEVTEGRDADDVVASWNGDTALSVRQAVSSLAPSGAVAGDTGLVTLG